jgi:hypothetical protein
MLKLEDQVCQPKLILLLCIGSCLFNCMNAGHGPLSTTSAVSKEALLAGGAAEKPYEILCGLMV